MKDKHNTLLADKFEAFAVKKMFFCHKFSCVMVLTQLYISSCS